MRWAMHHEHDWVFFDSGDTYSGKYIVRYRCCICNMRRDDFFATLAECSVTGISYRKKILEEHYF